MQTFTAHEAKTRFGELIDQCRAIATIRPRADRGLPAATRNG